MAIPNLLIEFEKFRHTREGFVEIILASQLIGERPIKWNTPYPLGIFGQALLQTIYATEFGIDLSLTESHVYWEFKLTTETGDSRWPDLAIRSPHRLILFELKTEDGSIRENQVDEQLLLGRHRFPGLKVDMIYITTNTVHGEPPRDDRSLYCNLTWRKVAALQRGLLDRSEERGSFSMICEYFDALSKVANRPTTGRTPKSKRSPARTKSQTKTAISDARSVVNGQGQIDFEAILEVFHQVESTGEQQALNVPCESPNAARRLIEDIENVIRASNQNGGKPILRTRPWIWTPESTGKPMTESGKAHDVEIRVSRYQKAKRAGA